MYLNRLRTLFLGGRSLLNRRYQKREGFPRACLCLGQHIDAGKGLAQCLLLKNKYFFLKKTVRAWRSVCSCTTVITFVTSRAVQGQFPYPRTKCRDQHPSPRICNGPRKCRGQYHIHELHPYPKIHELTCTTVMYSYPITSVMALAVRGSIPISTNLAPVIWLLVVDEVRDATLPSPPPARPPPHPPHPPQQ